MGVLVGLVVCDEVTLDGAGQRLTSQVSQPDARAPGPSVAVVADVVPHAGHVRPPRFPKTTDLLARQRPAGATAPDRESWMRDIRDADTFIDDDPFTGRG